MTNNASEKEILKFEKVSSSNLVQIELPTPYSDSLACLLKTKLRQVDQGYRFIRSLDFEQDHRKDWEEAALNSVKILNGDLKHQQRMIKKKFKKRKIPYNSYREQLTKQAPWLEEWILDGQTQKFVKCLYLCDEIIFLSSQEDKKDQPMSISETDSCMSKISGWINRFLETINELQAIKRKR